MPFPGIAALLALADQRLPSGGHVHSGGIEQAITDGLVTDVIGLEQFLERRLRTTGLVTAGLAAAATLISTPARASAAAPARASAAAPARASAGPVADAPARLAALDAEADARTPSPAQRTASRTQGRGLLRTAKAAWAAPSPALGWSDLGPRPHHPIVLGCAAAAGGVAPAGAAVAASYLSVSAPSTAAQRLLALDPVSVAAVTVRLGPAIEQVARLAVADLPGPPDDPSDRGPDVIDLGRLPDDCDPLLDLLAERHAAREERLFAS